MDSRPPARDARLAWIALGAAVLFLASGVWFAYSRAFAEDPGVAACREMRDHGSLKMTDEQYQRWRGAFGDSHDGALRLHGPRLLDLLRQFATLGGDEDPVPYLGPVTEHLAGLRSACAGHGAALELVRPPAPVAATGRAPECGIVFRPARPIAEKRALAGCRDPAGVIRVVAAYTCTDGRHLFQAGAAVGAVPGWGFGGLPYTASADPGQDPAYARTVLRCLTG